MLGLHKLIPLGNLFVILDGVDIDAAQSPDERLQFFNPLPHFNERQFFCTSKLFRRPRSQFIFIPQISNLTFPPLLQLFPLALQTEQILIQPPDASG